MRVLLVSHIFLPIARAGVETYTHELARALLESGKVEVAVATTRKIISLPTGKNRESSLGGLRIFEVVNNLDHESFRGTYANEAMERAFSAILERFRPDAVHFQHLMYWSLGLPALARRRGIRVLMTLHDFWLMCPRLGQLVDWQGRLCRLPEAGRCEPCLENFAWGQSEKARRWIKRLGTIRSWTGIPLDGPLRELEAWRRRRSAGSGVGSPGAAREEPPVDVMAWSKLLSERREAVLAMARELDVLISPSASLLARFGEWGLAPARIEALPQGRRHEPFAGLAARSTSSAPLRLAFIGTIAPHKGVLELIRAMTGLDPARVRLDVWGPFRQHADFEARCRAEADPALVRFHGPVQPEEIPGLYPEIDLLAVPSLWDECCPLTIQEAFMAGVPVIASDLGGMHDLLVAGGGLLIAPGRVEAWHAALARLLEEPGLLDAWRRTIPLVPTMGDHAARLRELYASS